MARRKTSNAVQAISMDTQTQPIQEGVAVMSETAGTDDEAAGTEDKEVGAEGSTQAGQNDEQGGVTLPNTEDQGETGPDEQEKIEPEEPEEETEHTDEESDVQKIPEAALKLLKIFNHYQELYISVYGGVYTANTKLDADKKAILYKNPFYNK